MAEFSAEPTPQLEGPASNEPGLYDFLYRDANRIASLYAQLFGGRLSSFQEANSRSQATERSGGVNFQVASGTAKSAGTTTDTSTRVIDPHDLIATDVLTQLMESGRIAEIADALGGALCHTSGTVVFADRSLSEMGFGAFFSMLDAGLLPDQDASALLGVQMIQGMLQNITFPSTFLLQSNEIAVVGTLKDEGMEEPISTYYFKHGAQGLPGVHLIGIKEVSTPQVTVPETEFSGGLRQATQALSELLFSPGAVRVTPIALFREL